jgi:hypothetical protein
MDTTLELSNTHNLCIHMDLVDSSIVLLFMFPVSYGGPTINSHVTRNTWLYIRASIWWNTCIPNSHSKSYFITLIYSKFSIETVRCYGQENQPKLGEKRGRILVSNNQRLIEFFKKYNIIFIISGLEANSYIITTPNMIYNYNFRNNTAIPVSWG